MLAEQLLPAWLLPPKMQVVWDTPERLLESNEIRVVSLWVCPGKHSTSASAFVVGNKIRPSSDVIQRVREPYCLMAVRCVPWGNAGIRMDGVRKLRERKGRITWGGRPLVIVSVQTIPAVMNEA